MDYKVGDKFECNGHKYVVTVTYEADGYHQAGLRAKLITNDNQSSNIVYEFKEAELEKYCRKWPII